jgi:hypothetical protein
MNPRRSKILGSYLLVISLLQVCLYIALAVSVDTYDWLFYFDPRIGIFFLETCVRGAEQIAPGLLRWASAALLVTLGLLLLRGRSLVKTYIVLEVMLLLPNIVFFVLIIPANLSPAHGFSVRELFFPVLVAVAFSIIPLGLACWARSKGAEVELSNPARA